MKKIGIIGASSQVGSSLALYLKLHCNVEVVCFVRSAYSRVFFETCNIPCDSIDLNNNDQLTEKLHQFDLIVDCTYPTGQLFEIPRQIKTQIQAVVSAMRSGTGFIYMSSIMAYGMGDDDFYVGHHTIVKSSYAYIKRVAEKTTFEACKKAGVKAFVFRLGQVHGFLQSVSAGFRKNLSKPIDYFVRGKEDEKTNTIFISSVAEAILNCVKENARPGLYTLVSQPQWTLKQLYQFYTEMYALKASVKFIPHDVPASLSSRMKSLLMKVAKRRRNLLETYVLMKRPDDAIRLKGSYRINEAKAALSRSFTFAEYNLLGNPPHGSVEGVNCEYDHIFRIEREIETKYNSLIDAGRKQY